MSTPNIPRCNGNPVAYFQILRNLSLKEYVAEKWINHHFQWSDMLYQMYGKYRYLLYYPEDYCYYMITDLFHKEITSSCPFGNHISPLEFYQLKKDDIIQKLKEEKKEPHPQNISSYIYSKSPECYVHNPLIMKYFINFFHSKSVLDLDIGIGDRLIGSMLGEVDVYLGYHPQKCMSKTSRRIIKLFRPLLSKGEYTIMTDPIVTEEKFDLIYMSYRNSPEEVSKYIRHLKMGGHLILDLQEVGNKIEWMDKIKFLYYLGNIFYTDIFFKNFHPLFIFQKSMQIPENLYNPPPTIVDYRYQDKKIHVIRDDYVIGGTKTRALIPYLTHLLSGARIKELLYLGASNGFAPVALAYGLHLLRSDIKLTIYSQKTDLHEAEEIIQFTRYLYPHANYVLLKKSFRDIWPIIDRHLAANPHSFLIPFGLHDTVYEEFLYTFLGRHLGQEVDKIARLWVPVGSGVLFRILYKILYKTHFQLVQTGKSFDISDYDQHRITLHISSYKLYSNLEAEIPYPTLKSYDGKIWEFRDKIKDGDYFWNVGKIPGE